MRERAARIRAIVVADLLIRFRRWSTAIVFLLLGASAYLWVPDPSSGRALLVVDGRRAVYNSATIGMGTAALATIFVGMFGFYFISNAFRHDVRTRCGFVIASTPTPSVDYLLGKFLGNFLFLAVFVFGFFLTSMLGLLIRAEAPLEPLVFLKQYLLLIPPAMAMAAMLAIVFESVSWLSGRFGDVAFFFLWISGMGVVAVALYSGGPALLRYLDYSGFAFMMDGMTRALHTSTMTIGASPFDPAKPTLVFDGLHLGRDWALPRLAAVFLPLILLPVALRSFHRFDPARIRRGLMKPRGARTHWRWLTAMNGMFAPLVAGGRESPGSLWDAVRREAWVTLSTFPLAAPAALAFAAASLAVNPSRLCGIVLPILFFYLSLLLAGIACREARAGTGSLVWACPMLRKHFILWKFSTALLVCATFLFIPVVRLLAAGVHPGTGLVVGALFLCAAATGLGALTGNSKPFFVLFLTFFYIVVNDAGRTAVLNFAGFYGPVAPSVMAGYAFLAALFLGVAAVGHRFHARLEEW